MDPVNRSSAAGPSYQPTTANSRRRRSLFSWLRSSAAAASPRATDAAQPPVDGGDLIRQLRPQGSSARRQPLSREQMEHAQPSALPESTKFTDAAIVLQRLYRGAQTRKNLKIQSVGIDLIHTEIHGGEDVFAQVGIYVDPLQDENNNIVSRTLNILSANPQRYSRCMVGGDKLVNPISSNNENRKELIGDCPCNIFINGGNFNTLNSGKTFEGHPPYRPIGPTKTKQTDVFIPTPEENKSDYARIAGDDGSYISIAPVLSKAGQNVFSKSKLNEPKYNYETIRQGKAPMYPGLLYHASNPVLYSPSITPGFFALL